jgi:hypothetical protein
MAPRFLSSLLHSLHKSKSRRVPAFPPKPVMSTKTAQLGGTASDVTVGKVGVSVFSLDPPHPDIDLPTTFLARFDDDDVRSSLLRCHLSQYRCLEPSWRNPPTPDEEAFASLKAGIDGLPPGTKMFLNSGAYTKNPITLYFNPSLTGEFYGLDPPSANLELLARFFERYPDYADKAFLSVKVSISRFGARTRLHAQNGCSVAHHPIRTVTCMFSHQLLK